MNENLIATANFRILNFHAGEINHKNNSRRNSTKGKQIRKVIKKIIKKNVTCQKFLNIEKFHCPSKLHRINRHE